MANKIKLHPNQLSYTCNKCGTDKPTSEFYVNRKRRNGLQANCKTCCKESNAEFRIKRPLYYWDEENQLGYLQKNYDRFKEIVRKSNAADKSNKVYGIDTPDGTYIGATSRHFYARKANHKFAYFRFRNNSHPSARKRVIPGLYQSFDKYTIEEVEKMINGMYIIEEWDGGDRKELLQRETQYIKKWISEGKPVLNKHKIK